MRIGSITLPNAFFVAPMAGVTDRPFRMLCRRFGAGHAVSEMVTSKRELWATLKTSRRADHAGEPGPIAVQIAGVDAQEMADAARYNIDRGAEIIDINMGCPAKKVCNRWAGSALMKDEKLAIAIVEAVVAACAPRGVPVTLKMRTGWSATDPQGRHAGPTAGAHGGRNALPLARAAAAAGVAMVTVHGRTREMGYGGVAEHETVSAIKAAIDIPVVANGDIETPARALEVLRRTGVDAVMIGRAAMGRPWIFRDVLHLQQHGVLPPPPATLDVKRWLVEHLHDHYALYGEYTGVRSARKHIGWAVAALPGGEDFRRAMNALDNCREQADAVSAFFEQLADRYSLLPDTTTPPAPTPDESAANEEWPQRGWCAAA
jgi:tRNA-dihydrouridine synthase B